MVLSLFSVSRNLLMVVMLRTSTNSDCRFGIEGPVYLIGKGVTKGISDSSSDGLWIVDEENQTISTTDGSSKFKVLDSTLVRIEVVEPQPSRPKLQLTLIL